MTFHNVYLKLQHFALLARRLHCLEKQLVDDGEPDASLLPHGARCGSWCEMQMRKSLYLTSPLFVTDMTAGP